MQPSVLKIGNLKKGNRVKIVGLSPGNATYRSRLIAMGLLPGTVFSITRIAPLGDPIEIILRGYALSLRRSEAELLRVELQ